MSLSDNTTNPIFPVYPSFPIEIFTFSSRSQQYLQNETNECGLLYESRQRTLHFIFPNFIIFGTRMKQFFQDYCIPPPGVDIKIRRFCYRFQFFTAKPLGKSFRVPENDTWPRAYNCLLATINSATTVRLAQYHFFLLELFVGVFAKIVTYMTKSS